MDVTIYNKTFNKRSVYLLVGWSIFFCLIIALTKEFIFPPKYFGDVLTIENLINNSSLDTGDKSFENTAAFFRILGLDRYILLPVLTIILYTVSIAKLFKSYGIQKIQFKQYLLISIYSAIAMVYMSTYSKELVLFILVIFSFIFLEKKHLLVWTIIVLVYAFFFRTYWFLVIGLFWGLKLFYIRSPYKLLLSLIVVFTVMALMFEQLLNTPLSTIREAMNLDRTSDIAKTMIINYIEGDSAILQGANASLTFILLMFPIPLLAFLQPFYMILFILISHLFISFFRFVSKNSKNNKFENIFALIISLITIQSLFEPDYGSFLKHLAPLFPLFFLTLNYKNYIK